MILKALTIALLGTGAIASLPAHAIEDLTESDMSNVVAQDGITVEVTAATSATTFDAGNVRWTPDLGDVNQESYLSMDGVKFGSIGANGTASAVPLLSRLILDTGASAGGVPYISLAGSWDRSRLKVNALTLKPSSTTSFGSLAFDSEGSFAVSNAKGFFDNGCSPACTASLSFGTTPGKPSQMYYRQVPVNTATSPELLFDNMNFSLVANNSQLSIKPTGIYFSQPSASLNWNFDLRYRSAVAVGNEYRSDMSDITNFIYFGLESGLVNPVFEMKTGGVWLTGSPTYNESVRTQGLNFSFITDLDPATFALVLGEGGSSPTLVRFENWRTLKPGAKMLSIPNFTVDVVHGGGAGVPNIPTDFCLGVDGAATASQCNNNFKDRDPTPATGTGSISRYVTSPATGGEGDAIALLARNVQLLAYPTKVKLVDPSAGTTTFNWGLLTTTGNMDATVLAYPGNSAGTGPGVKLDMVISASTPQVSAGDWDESQGTHFIIADTDANTGIGFMNMNYMIKADNLFMALKSTGIEYSCSGVAGATSCFSLYADGQFGGGDLYSLSDKTKSVRAFDIIIRQNFSNFTFTLTPASNQLQYSAAMTLDSAMSDFNYVMFAEPDYDSVAFKFGKMSGAATITNGSIDLRPSNTTPDTLPRLTFSQSFNVTSDLKVDEISFNGQSLGRLVIPAGGSIYTQLSLKQQIP